MTETSRKNLFIAIFALAMVLASFIAASTVTTATLSAENISDVCSMSLHGADGSEKWLSHTKLLDEEYTTYASPLIT